jgi:hypothetical protein
MTNRLSEIKIASFNAKGGLGNPELAERVADVLLSTDADVIGIPDAYHEDTERSTPTDRRLEVEPHYFESAGYDVYDSVYAEERPFGDDNWAKYHQMTLVRQGIGTHAQTVALGQRYGVVVDVDLALDKDVSIARFLNTGFAKAAFGGMQFGNGMLPRLIEMASGETIDRLNAMGLHDADPGRRSTMPAKLPLFQFDQVRVTSGVEATPTSGTAHKGLSDHKLIKSTVRLRLQN